MLQVEKIYIVHHFRQDCDAVVAPECLRADTQLQVPALECCGPLADDKKDISKVIAPMLCYQSHRLPQWPMLASNCKANPWELHSAAKLALIGRLHIQSFVGIPHWQTDLRQKPKAVSLEHR